MSSADQTEHDDREPVRVKDNRKIDRETSAAGGDTTPPAGGGAEGAHVQEEAPDTAENTVAAARDDLPEGDTADGAPGESAAGESAAGGATVPLEDLQRLSAEYTNYRRRAERERLAAGDHAVGRVLADLLPIADDLGRAREHGDLTGPLKAVADKLDGVFAKAGLVSFGEVGDAFDPNLHEAVLHDESDTVTVPTCTTVMRQGYRYKDRVIRAAMVGVSDPTTPAATDATDDVSAPDAQPTDQQ